MNETESKPISGAPVGSDTDRIAMLERQVSTLLLALVILAGIFTVYLLRQYKTVSSDLETFKPGAVQLIDAMKREGPNMDKFLLSLIDYGKKDPSFKPIVDKYGLTSPSVVTPGAAATSPAPAAPPTQTPATAPKK